MADFFVKPASDLAASKVTSDALHVVAALIWQTPERESFLIAKRPVGKHLENFWEFPGGKVEANETPLMALERELMEEIGLLALKAIPYQQVLHSYDDREILLDVWEVTSFEGEVSAKEGQKIAWITVPEIDTFQFPDADIPILKTIVNNASA